MSPGTEPPGFTLPLTNSGTLANLPTLDQVVICKTRIATSSNSQGNGGDWVVKRVEQ